VARLEGSDPALKDQYVVYSAHWDHFGVGTPVKGDSIYNGALDNATGTAGLLAMAKAYNAMPVAPKRSIVFLAVTAEEQGLLGAQYYSVTPLYPLSKTVANINMDGLNTWGPTKDLVVIGLGASELDDYASAAAAEKGRVLAGRRAAEGVLLPPDHFTSPSRSPRLRRGRMDYRQAGRLRRQKRDEYTANDYHAPQTRSRVDLGAVAAPLPHDRLRGRSEDAGVARGERAGHSDKCSVERPDAFAYAVQIRCSSKFAGQ
jgi:hypothetical protein